MAHFAANHAKKGTSLNIRFPYSSPRKLACLRDVESAKVEVTELNVTFIVLPISVAGKHCTDEDGNGCHDCCCGARSV